MTINAARNVISGWENGVNDWVTAVLLDSLWIFPCRFQASEKECDYHGIKKIERSVPFCKQNDLSGNVENVCVLFLSFLCEQMNKVMKEWKMFVSEWCVIVRFVPNLLTAIISDVPYSRFYSYPTVSEQTQIPTGISETNI